MKSTLSGACSTAESALRKSSGSSRRNSLRRNCRFRKSGSTWECCATLIVSDSPGQAESLLRSAHNRRRTDLPGFFAGILACRFRGFDAHRLLDAIYTRTRWLFSWVSQAALAMLLVAAVVLVFRNHAEFRARLPDARALFHGDNLILLLASISMAKLLHELGHGLACRHFGGECHEVGLMLLFGTPCLYCNVTDAWTFPKKWHRIAVSAAGIWVELVLAAVCTLLWWSSEPGLLNSLCLNLMVVCSVGTVLLNGNPLLRFDAYYVVGDLLEIPNLGPRAAQHWKSRLGRWLLGADDFFPERPEPNGTTLLVYGAASAAYRVVLTMGILWGFHQLLKPYHLEFVTVLAAIGAACGLFWHPLSRCAAFLNDPDRRNQLLSPRGAFRLASLTGLFALLFLVPLPYRVSAPLQIEPSQATRIYVRVPGTVVESASEGRRVNRGEIILQLQNRELESELAQLRGTTAQQRIRLENLRRRQSTDPQSAAEIPTAEEVLADLEERLQQKRRDEERLTLRAPHSGTIYPPHPGTSPDDAPVSGLSNRSPLREERRGSYVEVGTEICRISDSAEFVAALTIDQSDIALVRPGQTVRLILDERPGEVLHGTLVEVAEVGRNAMFLDFTNRAALAPANTASDLPRAVYEARVSFDSGNRQWIPDGTGRAKIEVSPMSIAARLARYINRTFRLEL
jgi:putative peptide zinc metalloprotease protein